MEDEIIVRADEEDDDRGGGDPAPDEAIDGVAQGGEESP